MAHRLDLPTWAGPRIAAATSRRRLEWFHLDDTCAAAARAHRQGDRTLTPKRGSKPIRRTGAWRSRPDVPREQVAAAPLRASGIPAARVSRRAAAAARRRCGAAGSSVGGLLLAAAAPSPSRCATPRLVASWLQRLRLTLSVDSRDEFLFSLVEYVRMRIRRCARSTSSPRVRRGTAYQSLEEDLRGGLGCAPTRPARLHIPWIDGRLPWMRRERRRRASSRHPACRTSGAPATGWPTSCSTRSTRAPAARATRRRLHPEPTFHGGDWIRAH